MRNGGSRTPFQFFSSHPEPKLIESTRAGRFAEFAQHGWKAEDVADPMDPATFQRSKLDWSDVDSEPYARTLQVYRDLIALRRRRPELSNPRLDQFHIDFNEDERWLVLLHRGSLRVIVNLSLESRQLDLRATWILLASGESTVEDGVVRVPAESFAVVEVEG